MYDRCLIASGSLQCQFQRVRDLLSFHRCTQFPGDDVATEIVKDRQTIKIPPANGLQIREVGLPQVIDAGGFVLKLVGSTDHHMARSRDEIFSLENAIG